MKNIILITFLFLIYGCGYTSVYNPENIDFQITFGKVSGDRGMNNLIKNELRLYSNKKSVNIYNIKIDTDYKKETLTKDSSGIITDYSLSATSIFVINFNELTETVTFEENINVKNQTDTFEQKIYEENIQKNFASSIRRKLISKILSLNDN
jgi:hypothetical protein